MTLEPFTPTLLITDDDAAMRSTLRDAFEPRGFATRLAADGDEAIDVVRRETVHVVLLDLHMPRMSGLETLRALRAMTVPTSCILMSSAVDDVVEREALAMDAFRVVAKPFRFTHLSALVRDALARSLERLRLLGRDGDFGSSISDG